MDIEYNKYYKLLIRSNLNEITSKILTIFNKAYVDSWTSYSTNFLSSPVENNLSL